VFAVIAMVCSIVILLIAGLVLCIVILAKRADGGLYQDICAAIRPSPTRWLRIRGLSLLMASLTLLGGLLRAHGGAAWNILVVVPVWPRSRG